MMERVADREDCTLERDAPFCTIIDSEGDDIIVAPIDFKDDQMWFLLKIANRYYSKGIEDGKNRKTKEIAEVLGLNK